MAYKIVLTSDRSLMSEYRDIPLGDFFSCAPKEIVPKQLFLFFAKKIPVIDNGIARRAPYGLRKFEASILDWKINEIATVDPDYIKNFINNDTQIVGVNTMDPLALGPVSMMFTLGGKTTSYSKFLFSELIKKIGEIRKKNNYKFKLLVGGPGAWQFELRSNYLEKEPYNNIDNIIIGEYDGIADKILHQILNNAIPRIYRHKEFPIISQTPMIRNASSSGLVEIMRGCGRNCEFCEPNLRRARYQSVDYIKKEIEVNVKSGYNKVWAQSEDFWLYKLEDHRNFIPNSDALIELFSEMSKIRGLNDIHPTHGSIAPAAYAPDLVKKLSEIMHGGKNYWIGVQPGLETGSARLLKQIMPYKAKPFSADEWADVVVNGTINYNTNYWFPAYTLILGIPGETNEDLKDTIRLLHRMENEIPEKIGKEKSHFVTVPLSFIPAGIMHGDSFFDIDKEMTELRFFVLYMSWRHIVYELTHAPEGVVKNMALKFLLYSSALPAFSIMVHWLKAWAQKKGYDLTKIDRIVNS